MKLLVFSDSHRETEPMLCAIRQESPDTVLHLGDHTTDAEAIAQTFPFLPLVTVQGNCDRYGPPSPEQALLQWQGVKVFAVHGHRYGVKSGLLRLEYAALEKGANVAVFGHTHCPCCEQYGDLWLLNPGACGGRYPTYGMILIENGTVTCTIKEVIL